MDYWVLALITLIIAIIAYDKKWPRLATLFYFITFILFFLEAVEIWTGIGFFYL